MVTLKIRPRAKPTPIMYVYVNKTLFPSYPNVFSTQMFSGTRWFKNIFSDVPRRSYRIPKNIFHLSSD